MAGHSFETKSKAGSQALADLYVIELLANVGQADTHIHRSSDNEFGVQLERLRNSGLAENSGTDSVRLTTEGRKEIRVVMAGGSFDIIHPGHIETLEKAKALGDVLVVSVARDSTYLRNKKKKPLHNEDLRRKLVGSIKFVDAAILGSEEDIFKTVEIVRPDIVALGYDQSHDEIGFRRELSKRGLNVEVVRLDSSIPDIKTSRIARDYY